jgi:hypothetical protein
MATKKILSIRYTLVAGQLPNGITLNPDTGALSGSPGSDALGLGPTWNTTAGSIGTYDEGNTITTVTFNTTSNKGPVSYGLASDDDKLPWGLELNPVSGTISGTIAPLLLRVAEAGVTFDGPTWTTPFGRLAAYDEDFVSSISLTAAPRGSRTIKHYQVIDGALPWGLELNGPTGVISGKVGRLKNPGAFVDVPKLPIPVWTNSAALGTICEYESATYTLIATPDTGRSMAKYSIREGALPFGLTINSQTGVISGSAVELKKRNEPVYYDATNDPTFSNTVKINNVDTTVQDGGSIGSYAKGATVSAIFSATAVSGRAIRNYAITNGVLPFGLSLNSMTGEISGTILNTVRVQSKTYTFTVTAIDKNANYFLQNKTSRSFTLTVQ